VNPLHIDTVGIIKLTAADLIGQSIAILGIKGSGKSNTAAVLMEELLAAGIPVCIVDIAGEYHTLKDDYNHLAVIGRSITTRPDFDLNQGNVEQLAEKIYTNGLSVVIDLSGYQADIRPEILNLFFRKVWELAARLRIPQVTFLEEAHNWIPQRKQTAASEVFIDIAAEGRKRGLSLIMIGQRSARIQKDTLTQADISFLHRVRHPTDINIYRHMIPRPPRWVRDTVFSLKTGEVLALVGDRVLRAQIRERKTRHVGATPTVQNIPAVQMSLLDLMEK
jgi:DNA helicase HerA-like ATPase